MPRDWIFSYQREGFSGLLSGLQIQYAQVGLTDLPKVYKKIPLCKDWKQRRKERDRERKRDKDR